MVFVPSTAVRFDELTDSGWQVLCSTGTTAPSHWRPILRSSPGTMMRIVYGFASHHHSYSWYLYPSTFLALSRIRRSALDTAE